MAFVDLLAAICLFVNGSKGRSAVQLSRELGVQYKTAWVMAHKIPETMQDEYEGRKVGGEGEIDGAYFGGHIRPANMRGDPGVSAFHPGALRFFEEAGLN